MTKNKQPLVSILIAVYNESLYLYDCISSLLGQDYPYIEIVIIDDFSNDNTFEIATKLAQNNPNKIKIYKNTIKGKASAFSMAFEKSTGDIVTLIGGDDLATKSYIISRLPLYQNLLKKSDKVCVFGKLKSFSEDKKYNNIITPKNIKACNNFSGGLMMFSRSLAEMTFPIPSELPSEDGWVGLHARFFSINMCIDEIVLHYRIHRGNTINRGVSFKEASLRISSRRYAENVFLSKYSETLDIEKKNILENEILMEFYRANGNYFKLIILTKVGLSDRLRALSYSNKFIYLIRMKFFTLFSGR